MSGTWLGLEPNDWLFFRGSEPFNTGESGHVQSEFPPTPRTLQGAIRAAFLESGGVDMKEYIAGKSEAGIVEVVGKADEEIRLDLRGPYLTRYGEPCVPAPLNLAEKDGRLIALIPNHEPTATDAGDVRLLEQRNGALPTEGMWMRLSDLEQFLAGEDLSSDILFTPFGEDGECFLEETKVGLARNETRRVAEEGMLYSISTLRAAEGAGFSVEIRGLPEDARRPDIVKWGGEGRFVWSREISSPKTGTHREEVARLVDKSRAFCLVFLQPALFRSGWLPEDFREDNSGNAVRWRGNLAGIECDLVSVALGKPRNIGGWDMKSRRPHPLRPHVPAGSVYFFETAVEGKLVVETLDDSKLGENTNMGFGHVLTGGLR